MVNYSVEALVFKNGEHYPILMGWFAPSFLGTF